jgi:hypothetical protein
MFESAKLAALKPVVENLLKSLDISFEQVGNTHQDVLHYGPRLLEAAAALGTHCMVLKADGKDGKGMVFIGVMGKDVTKMFAEIPDAKNMLTE